MENLHSTGTLLADAYAIQPPNLPSGLAGHQAIQISQLNKALRAIWSKSTTTDTIHHVLSAKAEYWGALDHATSLFWCH